MHAYLIFESELVQIQDTYKNGLVPREQEEVSNLLLRREITAKVNKGETFIVERTAKQLKSNRCGGQESLYVNTRFYCLH